MPSMLLVVAKLQLCGPGVLRRPASGSLPVAGYGTVSMVCMMHKSRANATTFLHMALVIPGEA